MEFVRITVFGAFLVILFSSTQSLTFTSKDSSFVQFSPNWLPSSPQGISFKFKTLDADALLFLHYFANKTQDEPSYLFWLELKQGKLLASHPLDENVET